MVKALLIKGADESLRYLHNDINLMREAFSQIAISVATASGDRIEILTKITEIVKQCGHADTLIIYYTGHGLFINKKINLKVGSSGNNVDDFLSVDMIIDSILLAHLKNTVLIFDCCYASVAEAAWNAYADHRHILFLPSDKLETAEELEEWQSSYFTHCIYEALNSKDSTLYKDGIITLDALYHATRSIAVNFNQKNATNKPIPVLIGMHGKKIVLGTQKQADIIDEDEKLISGYVDSFKKCIGNCKNKCSGTHIWCSTLIKSDAEIAKYVIPSVKEFLSMQSTGSIAKLNAFFDSWFKTQRNYLCILGDMGVGKTSACFYLFYYLATKYSTYGDSFVPVYIPLSVINDRIEQEKDIYNIIGVFMSDTFKIETIKALVQNGRMVFILDGFDEISGDSSTSAILKSFEMIKPIMRFGCKTVLTCRTHYFSEQDQLEEVLTGETQGTDFAATLLNDEYPFKIVELQEFDVDDILEFIACYLPDKNPKEVWDNICDIYDLKDLSKRAILLKMIILTLADLKKSKSPINSVVLYGTYTKKLLRREMKNRKIRIEPSEKENFIGYIASLMFQNNELTISTRKFDNEIRQYFADSFYTRDDMNNCNYDCKVSAFFSRDFHDNYRFMHKSFFEYYFALYCVCQSKEGIFTQWENRWFPREIARFIKELLEGEYKYLIPRIMQVSLETSNSIVIWNSLHVLSLLELSTINQCLSEETKQEYIRRAHSERRSVIIRQYCRIIAKFIDRAQAETLIDRIICIVKNDPCENADNDQTYYNYYGGKQAALQAFIKHLSVPEPKYDAKLHLYLLEHLATKEYADKILDATLQWPNLDDYRVEISKAIEEIARRSD